MPVFRMDASTVTEGSPLLCVGVERLRRGRFQPRHDFPAESLRKLAGSIRSQGVVQPIVVRPLPGGDYEIVAGERRWRAAQQAGLREVPVVVRTMDDKAAALVAMAENVQREDLNPVDEAEGLARLVEELGLTHQDIADALGYKREHVSHLLRITRLEPEVKELIATGALTFGHAKVLAGLPRDQQVRISRQAASKRWTVRRLEREARLQGGGAGDRPGRDPDIERLARKVGETVGSPASLDFDEASKNGTIAFRFHSLEELEGILVRLGVHVER